MSDPIRTDVDPQELAAFEADYGDAFRLPAEPGPTALEWAKRSLHGVDRPKSAFRTLIWGGALGLEMAPHGSPGTQFGWQVTVDEPRRLVLDSDGRVVAGRLLFVIDDDGALTWSTLLRYRSARGRLTWAALSPIHRTVVPRNLAGAAAYAERHPTAAVGTGVSG